MFVFRLSTEQVILNIFKPGKENRNKLALFCSKCVTVKKPNTAAFKKGFISIFFSLCVCVHACAYSKVVSGITSMSHGTELFTCMLEIQLSPSGTYDTLPTQPSLQPQGIRLLIEQTPWDLCILRLSNQHNYKVISYSNTLF